MNGSEPQCTVHTPAGKEKKNTEKENTRGVLKEGTRREVGIKWRNSNKMEGRRRKRGEWRWRGEERGKKMRWAAGISGLEARER